MRERFLIISIILFFIILISEYIAYASLHYVGIIKSSSLEITLMIIGVAFPLIFIGSMLYGYKNYSFINSWFNTISSVWLGIIFYLFIASFVTFLLIMINYYFNLQIPIKIISSILIILILGLVSYGIVNANNIRIIKYDVKSDKLSKDWANKKIVMISDIHIGSIRRDKFIEKIVDTIKSENPDITFNLGDLIDGSSFPYEKWFNPLLSLNPELGNYYVEGNHERYNQEYDKFKSELPESLNNVTDKKTILNNTQIIGLSHREQESEDEITSRLISLEYDPSIPSIILIHDPKNVEALSKNGTSLVLSGHTHGGQFFPWTILINSLYKKYARGVSYTNETASVTSVGAGTSIIPIRIGTSPEIIVININ